MENNKHEATNKKNNLQETIKVTVNDGNEIRKKVRNITLQALTNGELNISEIKKVSKTVVKGAEQGVSNFDELGKKKLENAVAGLDDALSSAAEATKLALEEAASHIKTFSQKDFQQTIDDLLSLETIYLDSLKHVAKDANEFTANTLNDLVKHTYNSGSKVGIQTTKIVKILNNDIGKNLNEKVVTAGQTTLKVTSQLSYAAAGFLEGIAQTLEDKAKNNLTTKN